MTEKKLLKPKELAPILNVNVRTIYLWASKGILPVAKAPNTKILRFDLEKVLAAMNTPEEVKQNS